MHRRVVPPSQGGDSSAARYGSIIGPYGASEIGLARRQGGQGHQAPPLRSHSVDTVSPICDRVESIGNQPANCFVVGRAVPMCMPLIRFLLGYCSAAKYACFVVPEHCSEGGVGPHIGLGLLLLR